MKKNISEVFMLVLLCLLLTSSIAFAVESSEDNTEDSYVFTSIEDAAQFVKEGIKEHKEVISFTCQIPGGDATFKIRDAVYKHDRLDPTGGDYILWHYPIPEVSGSSSEGNPIEGVEVIVEYGITLDQEKELDVAIENCLKKLGVEGKSEYEKVKLIYDYICKNVKYDTKEENAPAVSFTAYGAMVKKKAVCQGYATLFYRMALASGLDARVIAGVGKGNDHGWNIVKIGDVYYNLDTTWDANYADGYRYFLQSDENFLYHKRYSEYKTDEFYAEYPMATSDYGLDSVNLAAPSDVKAELYGYNDIKVSWNKVKGAKGYHVYYTRPSWDYHVYEGATSKLSYKVSNLSSGAGYVFRIVPYTKVDGNKYDSRHYKDSSKIYTLKKLNKPSIKKASKKYVRVSWNNISGESGYQIAKSAKKTKGFKVVKTVNYKYKTAKIKVKRNKTYYYKVRAYKTVNGEKVCGPWSSVKSYKLK